MKALIGRNRSPSRPGPGWPEIIEQLEVAVRELTPAKEHRHVNTKQQLVDRYMDGFRCSDHEAILACLTDNVVWRIHGFRSTHGKAEFDDEIENPAFKGSPELSVERTIEAGDIVVVTGEGVGHHRETGRFRFAYCDLFTFRDGLIAQVDSYVVPLS